MVTAQGLRRRGWIAQVVLAVCVLAIARPAAAHCDALDGPVVEAAREALRTGDFSPIAIWVQPAQEPALQAAFRHALAVRELGPKARDLADSYFFETAVRLHREGEGEPYTGLKPAGNRDIALDAADRAIASGDDRALTELLVARVRNALHERFRDAVDHRVRRRGDIAAGRAYVVRYIAFVHYVVGIYGASSAPGAHNDEPERHED